jgi:hypothetical protein
MPTKYDINLIESSSTKIKKEDSGTIGALLKYTLQSFLRNFIRM